MKIDMNIPQHIAIIMDGNGRWAAQQRGRGDTDEEKVLKRLQQARVEYRAAPRYQYIVVNDRLEDAVSDIQTVLRAEALKSEHQQHLLKEAD